MVQPNITGMKTGLTSGLYEQTQLRTQGTAVTAVAYTASGAIADDDAVVTIATNSAAYTLSAPVIPGRILVITQSGTGTITVTQDGGNGTFDGTNNTATFNAAAETLILYGINDKRWLILENVGAVALSAV